jgi:hypothetical protein
MDYRENPEETVNLMEELEEGDRVYIEADAAELDEENEGNIFKRGNRVLIDDHGTVIESNEFGVKVELDKQWVDSAGEPDKWSTNVFHLAGEPVIAEWKYVGEEERETSRVPADLQVAMLNRIERAEEE